MASVCFTVLLIQPKRQYSGFKYPIYIGVILIFEQQQFYARPCNFCHYYVKVICVKIGHDNSRNDRGR